MYKHNGVPSMKLDTIQHAKDRV